MARVEDYKIGEVLERLAPEGDPYDVVAVAGTHRSAQEQLELILAPVAGFDSSISADPDLLLEHYRRTGKSRSADSEESILGHWVAA